MSPKNLPAEADSRDPARLRRARIGATIAFTTNGAMLGSILPRYPEIQDLLGVGTAAFGLLITAMTAGAICAFALPALLLRHWGDARVSQRMTWAMAVMFTTAATGAALGQAWVFVAGLFIGGLLDACADVAQNAQGLRVQDAMGKSVLTTMHAGWSLGAAGGGLIGVACGALGVPLYVQMGTLGVLLSIVVTLASRWYLPSAPARATLDTTGEGSATDEERTTAASTAGTRSDRPHIRLAIPGLAALLLIGIAGMSVEDVGNNWSAIYLHSELGAGLALAGTGVSVVLGAQFVGRVFGDSLINRLGARAVVRLSLAAMVAGFLLISWAPWMWLVFAGFALAGAGSAVTIPVVFAEADRLPGLRANTGVAVINWLIRTCGLLVTPTIGLIGGLADLRVAFTAAAVVSAAAWFAAAFVDDRRRLG